MDSGLRFRVQGLGFGTFRVGGLSPYLEVSKPTSCRVAMHSIFGLMVRARAYTAYTKVRHGSLWYTYHTST